MRYWVINNQCAKLFELFAKLFVELCGGLWGILYF